MLRGTVADLTAQLESRDRTLQETQSELVELHSATTLSELENKLRAKSEHAEMLELELSKAKSLAVKLTGEKEVLEGRLQGESASQAAMKSWTDENTKTTTEIKELRKQLDDAETSRLATYEKLSAARSALSALQASTMHSQSQLTAANERIATLESSLSNSDRQSHSAGDRRDSLQGENLSLMAALEEVRGKVVSLTNEQVDLSNRNDTLARQLHDRETELRSVGGATAELAQKTLELNELKDEYERLEFERSELAAEVGQQGSMTDGLQNELRHSREAVVEHQRRLAIMEDDLAKSRTDLGIAEAARQELMVASSSHDSSIAELRSIISDLTQSRHDATRQAEESSATATSTIERLQLELESISAAHADVLSQFDAHRESSTSASNSSAQIVALESTLAAKEEEISRLASDLTTSRSESIQLNQFLSSATDEAMSIREENDELTAEIKVLQSNLEGLSGNQSGITEEFNRFMTILKERDEEVASLKEALEKTFISSARAVELEREQNLAREELQLVQAGLEEAKRSSEELREQAERQTATIVTLESHLDLSRANLTALESQISSAAEGYRLLQSSHDQLTTDNEYLSTSLEEARNAPPLLPNGQSSDHADAASKIELEVLRQRLDLMEEERHELEEESAENRFAAEEARTELRTMETELANKRAQVDNLEAVIQSSREEIDEVFSGRNDLERRNDDLNESMSSLQSQLDVLVMAKSELEEELSALKASNAVDRDREVADSITTDLEMTAETNELRRTIATLEEGVSRIREESESSIEEVANLSNELERNVGEVESLRASLERNRYESEQVIKVVEELTEVLARTQEDLAAREEEIEELRNRPSRPLSPQLVQSEGTPDPATHPYDRAYVDGIQRQHEADRSEARTQIRNLEERVLEAESSGHVLSKANEELSDKVQSITQTLEMEREHRRVKDRETEALRSLDQARSASPRSASTLSPLSNNPNTIPARIRSPLASPSRLVSPPLVATKPLISNPRVFAHRRIASHMPTLSENVAPGTETGFPFNSLSDQRTVEEARTASATRHARRASLSLLKTRIEDEVEVDGEKQLRSVVLGDELMACVCCDGDLFIV